MPTLELETIERDDVATLRAAAPVATRPLRTLFIHTSMPVGGAETLTVNLIRRLDRDRFAPELCCLKEPGPLGELLADEVPVHHSFLTNKYDVRIWPRLARLFRDRQIDAVVTVGAGDKMFWGRLAARTAGVPVVLSALHSTGWPDGIGRLNRRLTPITDGFIAVAPSHGRFLVDEERLPAGKVFVIPNGVDTVRFAPVPRDDADAARQELGIGWTDSVVTIVAALRPEKNHELFLEMASRIVRALPTSHFIIIGDGPRREPLEQLTREMGIDTNVHFLGSRNDVPRLLSATDVFTLTSHNEANPVSILEAMSVGRPVVATDVGSVREAVHEGATGHVVRPSDPTQLTAKVLDLLRDPIRAQTMGAAAREKVASHWSLESMVEGYERLIEKIWKRKALVVSSKS